MSLSSSPPHDDTISHSSANNSTAVRVSADESGVMKGNNNMNSANNNSNHSSSAQVIIRNPYATMNSKSNNNTNKRPKLVSKPHRDADSRRDSNKDMYPSPSHPQHPLPPQQQDQQHQSQHQQSPGKEVLLTGSKTALRNPYKTASCSASPSSSLMLSASTQRSQTNISHPYSSKAHASSPSASTSPSSTTTMSDAQQQQQQQDFLQQKRQNHPPNHRLPHGGCFVQHEQQQQPQPLLQQPQQQALAALRPASWNNSNTTTSAGLATATTGTATASSPIKSSSASSSPIANNNNNNNSTPTKTINPIASINNNNNMMLSINDPRQANLPRALQYPPHATDPVSDPYRKTLIAHAQLSQPLANGWKLYPHQKHAILTGLKQRRAILALDMGTGKTIIGCVWAKAFQRTFPDDCKVIIICPVSLKEQWQRTAESATELTAQQPPMMKCDPSSPHVFITSWAKIPSSQLRFTCKFVVVADEAHSMQSMAAMRTKETLKLVDHPKCIGVLLLTGTPLKNGKPSNLFPLLKAVRHPLSKCQRSYETHFCDGHYQQFGGGGSSSRNSPGVWKASGATNLEQLRQLASSHVLFLSKEQVLKELPPQTRQIHKVPVSHQWQQKHAKALQELATAYYSSISKNVNNDAVLGAIQRLRYVGSLAKVDAAGQLARQILQSEPAVVIFSSFVDVCKAIHHSLSQAGWEGELMTGDTPAKKRQDMVDRFQNGLSPVFVCTFGAGGVGLTLTAACTVILVDRPWTPGEANQAEDRVRRIGQTKPVTCIWISAFDVDEQIDSLLEQKKQTAAAVLDDTSNNNNNNDNTTMDAQHKLSILRMLSSILPEKRATPQGHAKNNSSNQK